MKRALLILFAAATLSAAARPDIVARTEARPKNERVETDNWPLRDAPAFGEQRRAEP
ncbi:MAG: hypothetical protein N2689_09200 [Verrucomicrobiae bacterium]|nr:hypothetical protein [Verrucomicrobiae bacterium]